MRHFFSPRSCSLTRLFSTTVLALTLFGAANAGAMIVTAEKSDIQPTFDTAPVTEPLADWSRDSYLYLDPNAEDADVPPLPSLSPDEPQISDAAASTDEAVASDPNTDNGSTTDATEDAASEVTDGAPSE